MLKKAVLAILFATSLSAKEPTVAQPSKEAQIEQTLSIIKPDIIESNQVGEILEYIETAGLKIVGSKMMRLTPEQAKHLYAAHKDAAFFNDLIAFITSGPVIVQVLEGERRRCRPSPNHGRYRSCQSVYRGTPRRLWNRYPKKTSSAIRLPHLGQKRDLPLLQTPRNLLQFRSLISS